MNMRFYERYFLMYITATQENRDAARKHWILCHKQNVMDKRDDLIIFSSKVLAMIDLAQDYIDKHTKGLENV